MRKSLAVRVVAYEDLAMLLSWRNHESVRRYMLTQHEITIEEHEQWFAKVIAEGKRCLLIVEEDGRPFGFAQLNNRDAGSIAEWGFYIRPDASKGSGLKLGGAILDYAFGELNLHKVCGQAIDFNAASIAFHRRLGFSQEGVLREQAKVNDSYHNLICFGLLSNEWNDDKYLGNNNAEN